MSRPLTIALDVMSGETLLRELILGVIEAVNQFHLKVILVGDKQKIQPECDALQSVVSFDPNLLSIQHADDVIGMDESPSIACLKKKKSSVMIAAQLVRDGEADGFFSPGNTGATLVASLMHIEKISGIERPGLMTLLPNQKGISVLMDAGANVNCSAKQLLQFAVMADLFCQHVLNIKAPSVGLLNIGEEDNKGNTLCLETFNLIKQSNLNFIGNIEGYDIFNGKADVIICDGFVGNITLKLAESSISFLLDSLSKEMGNPIQYWIARRITQKPIQKLRNRLNADNFGAAPILGLNQCVLVGHGKTSKVGIYNAIRMLMKSIQSNIYGIIKEKYGATDSE